MTLCLSTHHQLHVAGILQHQCMAYIPPSNTLKPDSILPAYQVTLRCVVYSNVNMRYLLRAGVYVGKHWYCLSVCLSVVVMGFVSSFHLHDTISARCLLIQHNIYHYNKPALTHLISCTDFPLSVIPCNCPQLWPASAYIMIHYECSNGQLWYSQWLVCIMAATLL